MSEMIDNLPRIRGGAMSSPFKTLAFSSLLPLALGVYLLTSGRAIHRSLMSVPLGWCVQNTGSDQSGVGLTGAELESFNTWIDAHPEIRVRAAVDQLALFRDAQRATDVR